MNLSLYSQVLQWQPCFGSREKQHHGRKLLREQVMRGETHILEEWGTGKGEGGGGGGGGNGMVVVEVGT